MKTQSHRRREGGFAKGLWIFTGLLVGLVLVGAGVMQFMQKSNALEEAQTAEFKAPQSVTVPTSTPQGGTVASAVTTTPEPIEETPMTTEPEPTLSSSVPADYQAGERHFQEGDYDLARDTFAAYVEQHPGNAWGHYMLGLSAWRLGDLTLAEESLDASLRLDPNHRKSALNLTRVRLDRERYNAALRSVQVAVKNHGDGESYRMLARVYHNLGMVADAESAYLQAVELNPDDVWALNNLGLLWIEAERFDEAVAPLARATRIDPVQPLFQNNLGIALERIGEYDLAGDAYRAALDADDTNQRALANLERVDRMPTTGETGFDLHALAEAFPTSRRTETLQVQVDEEPQPVRVD